MRFVIALYATAGALALAQPFAFRFEIGSPVASQDFHAKSAAFVFRTAGCPEPEKAHVSATAEGLVNGARRSIALQVSPANTRPGVYAVFQMWPPEGQWVVNIKGTCGNAAAGAVIPIGPKGFIRDLSKFFPRPASDAEIDAALKTVPKGESK
jgi:hypothetical protein